MFKSTAIFSRKITNCTFDESGNAQYTPTNPSNDAQANSSTAELSSTVFSSLPIKFSCAYLLSDKLNQLAMPGNTVEATLATSAVLALMSKKSLPL